MSHTKETEAQTGFAGATIESTRADSPASFNKSDSDLDDNYRLYQQQAGQQLDPVEAKRVLRKIDRRVLPVLIVIYLLQYLDKNGINYASAYGLEEGTHLEGQVCSGLL